MRLTMCILLLSGALGGCASREQAPAPAQKTATTEQEAAAEQTQSRRPLRQFDAQGRLIPSDEYIAGVRLPRGVELIRADEVEPGREVRRQNHGSRGRQCSQC